MKKVKRVLVGLGTIVILAVFLQYENRVEVPLKEPPLTGWHRSVVQDGPVIAARWQEAIERALAQHRSNLPSDLIVGIMLTESMGDPRARNSETGATGLLQVKPVVCKELRVRRCDLFNPHRNISLGVQYLRLLQKYGFKDERLILAYGVGPTRAREIFKKKKNLARHSRYVKKVLYAKNLGREIYPDS